MTAAVNEAPAKTEAELVEEELAHDKAVRQSKAVTLKDKDFMQIYKDNQKKFNLVPKKKKKVWDGKVNVDRKVVDNVKVIYSKEDFLDMYEQKYQVSDEDDSDTVSEDDYEIDSAAAESSKVAMPSANIAHKELATTTNPKGKTAEEQEVFALAGSLAGTKKLDEVGSFCLQAREPNQNCTMSHSLCYYMFLSTNYYVDCIRNYIRKMKNV